MIITKWIQALLLLFILSPIQSYSQAIENPPIQKMGEITFNTIESLVKEKNPSYPTWRLKKIISLYIEEATIEKINSDLAIAQMLHETGYLSYQGDVNPNQFNYAGIGAVGKGSKGAIFSTMQMGIRAQIQHLKAYATDAPLKNSQVDPRYHLVKKGSAKTLKELTGHWAMDPNYAISIGKILNTLHQIQNKSLLANGNKNDAKLDLISD